MSISVSSPSPASSHPDLARALEALPTLPYRHGFGLSASVAAGAALAGLDDLQARGADQARVLIAEREGQALAGLGLARQGFESGIYGMPMARSAFCFAHGRDAAASTAAAEALVDAALSVAAEWGILHWSLLVSADDDAIARAAIARGWILADSTLTYTWDVERPDTREGACGPEVTVRPSRPDDRELLAEMARKVYTTSIRTRYGNDPGLPIERTGELYAQWAARAVDGAFADRVAVAEVEGEVVGFDMLKLDAGLSAATGLGFGAKGIAAVTPRARGHRILSCLEGHLNAWQREQGGRFNIGRVLINNIRMQHALAKIGGVVTSAYHTFHAWLGRDA